MAGRAAETAPRTALPDGEAILEALPDPVLMIAPDGRIVSANLAAEQFFAGAASTLRRGRIGDLLPYDSPLLSLVAQARDAGTSVSDHDVVLESQFLTPRSVDVQIAPVLESQGYVIIVLHEQSITRRIDRQLTHRDAARSVTGMALVLAHEIKNPLSGIKGAAQLLESGLEFEDRNLTRLICQETDRICALVDRMEVFSDDRPLAGAAVNIHEVLNHVRDVARNGFAHHVRFTESYDPSLPSVHGVKDQLIQVFLNLVKNASEVVPDQGGEIQLSTAFRHSVRLAIPGSRTPLNLPLEVTIRDNGPGVPDDLQRHIFDPFVTTKATGMGLGLALVAKIIGDHGGIIDCESSSRGAAFRVLLPIHAETTERLPIEAPGPA